ncbi:MAG TPA: hypothetical protein VFX25_40295 [Streptosporangiaceae bacterium]|nr:hypothetical protein [Streptosporangiaceae bacterium]
MPWLLGVELGVAAGWPVGLGVATGWPGAVPDGAPGGGQARLTKSWTWPSDHGSASETK